MKIQKKVTIAGVQYTAKKLLALNKNHGCDFLCGDRCIKLSANEEIGIRIYHDEEIVGILDYGVATRNRNKRIFASPYKFLKY
jgi:hypothetical protein